MEGGGSIDNCTFNGRGFIVYLGISIGKIVYTVAWMVTGLCVTKN